MVGFIYYSADDQVITQIICFPYSHFVIETITGTIRFSNVEPFELKPQLTDIALLKSAEVLFNIIV